MPKEFSQWVAEMSNSIEDNSNFIKPTHNTEPLTNLQKRLHIADLLVPNPDTEDAIHDWMRCFCVTLNTYNNELDDEIFYIVIGKDLSTEYYATETYTAAKAWLNSFRQKVLLGKIK